MRTDTFGLNIIYPNPLKAGEELTVIVPTEIAFRSFSIHVTEMTGRTVYHKTTRNTDNFIIETTKFNKGCYIIRVYADQKYYGEKFIIQ